MVTLVEYQVPRQIQEKWGLSSPTSTPKAGWWWRRTTLIPAQADGSLISKASLVYEVEFQDSQGSSAKPYCTNQKVKSLIKQPFKKEKKKKKNKKKKKKKAVLWQNGHLSSFWGWYIAVATITLANLVPLAAATLCRASDRVCSFLTSKIQQAMQEPFLLQGDFKC